MKTVIATPTYLAHLSGVYWIEIGARVVKSYSRNGSLQYRVRRAWAKQQENAL